MLTKIDIQKNSLLFNKNKIYCIETSFDDFSIAIIEGLNVLKQSTETVSKHMWELYGGVVPNEAARLGKIAISNVYKEIDEYLNKDYSEIKYIALTNNPGLKSSLNIGKDLAKEISESKNIKIKLVNHLEGHFFANFLNMSFSKIPIRSLYFIFSGGNTKAYLVKKNENNLFDFDILSETRDIAVGDMLDKLARFIGFKHAGEMDQLKQYSDIVINLPNIKYKTGNKNDFSFSGIQTLIQKKISVLEQNKFEKGYIILNSVFNYLLKQIIFFKKKYLIDIIVIGGGVTKNAFFREKIYNSNIDLLAGDTAYSEDNAAMIGAASLFSNNSFFKND